MLDGLFYYYMMGVYLIEEGCEDEEPENNFNNTIDEDEANPENIDDNFNSDDEESLYDL